MALHRDPKFRFLAGERVLVQLDSTLRGVVIGYDDDGDVLVASYAAVGYEPNDLGNYPTDAFHWHKEDQLEPDPDTSWPEWWPTQPGHVFVVVTPGMADAPPDFDVHLSHTTLVEKLGPEAEAAALEAVSEPGADIELGGGKLLRFCVAE